MCLSLGLQADVDTAAAPKAVLRLNKKSLIIVVR